MIVLTNEFTAAGNKEGFESLAQIVNSLSATPINAKKIRHSLKNLCFHPPSASVLKPLIDLFKHELKEQSRCFKLLCHLLITHAPLANTSSQTNDLISNLSKLFVDQKKPSKSLDDLFRVFFYLCFYTETNHPLLIDTISKILKTDLGFLTSKKKKGLLGGGSHKKSPYPELILECLRLLVDMPNFENSAHELFSKSGVIDGIVNIYKSFGKIYKLDILAFLSAIKNDGNAEKMPPQLLDLINPEDKVIDSAFASVYLVNNQEKHQNYIKQVLEKSIVSSQHYIQYKMLLSSGPSDIIFDSIFAHIEPTESSLLPLLKYLEKSPRGIITAEKAKTITEILYQACQDSINLSNAVIGFMCVCFLSDEIDWICNFFLDIMKKFKNGERRKSVAIMIGRSWVAALNFPANKKFVLALFEKLIMNYGSCIDQSMFNEFVQKVAQAGCADDFIEIFRDSIEKLPAVESVIYILFGAAALRKYADEQIFAELLEVAKEYMETAEPAMISFYEMTLDLSDEE